MTINLEDLLRKSLMLRLQLATMAQNQHILTDMPDDELELIRYQLQETLDAVHREQSRRAAS